MTSTSTPGKIVDARTVSGPANGILGDVLEASARRCWIVACTYIFVLNCGSSRPASDPPPGGRDQRPTTFARIFFLFRQAECSCRRRGALGRGQACAIFLQFAMYLSKSTGADVPRHKHPASSMRGAQQPQSGAAHPIMHSERESAAKWDFAGVPIWNGFPSTLTRIVSSAAVFCQLARTVARAKRTKV